MIFDEMVRNAASGTRRPLTLSDPTGWTTGKDLYHGGTLAAMKLPAVNACVEIITDSVAKLPIYMMDSESKERISDHPVLQLLTVRPTEALTAFDYHKLMESRKLAQGNAYALIVRNAWLEPVELLPMPPSHMMPYMDTGGRLWYVGTNPKTGEHRRFWPADVLHYKAFSLDGIEGISVLRRAAQVIETALQSQGYEQSFYTNGAQLTGVLQTETDLSGKADIEIDGKKMSLKDRIRAEWGKIHTGVDNAFRIAVLDNGLKYQPITSTNRDAQFIESKSATVEDVCRLFGVPAYKLSAGKQTYASNVQAAIEYVGQTLAPIIAEHEQEDTYKLLLDSEQKRGLQLRRNMMGELRGDWTARGAWYKQMREVGAYSINDIRHLEDLPEVAGGDDRYASLNYVPAELFRELSSSRNGGAT